MRHFHNRTGTAPTMVQKLWRQNLLILAACLLAVCSLGTAYAILGTTLDIDGQATVKYGEPLRVAGVHPEQPPSSCGMSSYPPTWDNTSFNVDGSLPALNCVVVFNITVKNETDDVMFIKQIVEKSFNNSANMEYGFSITPSTSSSVVPSQGQLDFNIKFRYKSSIAALPSLTSFVASFSLVFEKVTPPVLTVTNAYRNFEVYRGNIATPPSSLYGRVAAVDDMDGVITSQIVRTCTNSASQTVTCPTTWYGQVRDNYKITFNVTNSLGLSAVPVSFAVKTWDFVELEGGENHSFALSSDGRVWAWGDGGNGRLGLGSTSDQTTPVYHSNLAGSTNVNTPVRRIVSIAANRGTSYAVDDSGRLWTWGDKSYNALGDGGSTTGNVTAPMQITLPNNAKAVEVDGNNHTGIVRTDTGDIYVWGYNTDGSAGTGNTTTITTPIKLTTMTVPVKKVAMGEKNGAAIDTSGNLWTWGSGTYGKLGSSGSGDGNLPSKYSGLTNVKDIKIGDDHMLALMENGDVYVWGDNYYGRLCSSSSSITSPYKIPVSNVVDIAVFTNSSHMVTANGKAYSCGGNTYGEIQVGYTGSPSGSTGVTTPTVNYQFASGITTISANTDTSHILISNMTAYGYGHNNHGQIGNSTTTNSATGVIWNFTVPAIYEW
ncbi:MAG: hypothetical protein LBL08_01590 [Candidatus Nomurabacteria bacterium]|jgi:alpha-tubulin suppressor-like RCC1 family protein|nr:hypothetical protein [Candidatus Nomurabacteria bacterium]